MGIGITILYIAIPKILTKLTIVCSWVDFSPPDKSKKYE